MAAKTVTTIKMCWIVQPEHTVSTVPVLMTCATMYRSLFKSLLLRSCRATWKSQSENKTFTVASKPLELNWIEWNGWNGWKGESVTVKRAQRRSTFSGFFGPPFLLSFTMNFSLQSHHVYWSVFIALIRSCARGVRLPDLLGLSGVIQGKEDVSVLADTVVSEALQIDE